MSSPAPVGKRELLIKCEAKFGPFRKLALQSRLNGLHGSVADF